MSNQNALCPSGDYAGSPYAYQRPKNRRGYLHEDGLCVRVDSEAQKNAHLLERALQGAITVPVTPPGTETEKNIVVDPLAFVRKPVADLRDVAPTAFNACEKAVKLKDKTLGGIYPNGNAEEMLDSRCDQ